MGLRNIFSFSHSIFCISKMYLVLFLMLTNGLQMHLWTNALPLSSNNQCKNKLVVNSGMFDLSKDVYDLKDVWKSCKINNSAKYARDPNSEVWKLCRSASHNLQILCNKTIPENKISDAKSIWQQESNPANICQDMQANVYSPQEDCEAKASSYDKEGCSVNKDIIDRILKNDPAFCQLCPMLKLDSDISMCVVLSNIWKTLFITSDVQEIGDNKPLSVEKKSEPLPLDGEVPKGQIPSNRIMQSSVLDQSSFNNVYNSALQKAADLSLKAHEKAFEPMKAGEPNISGSQYAASKVTSSNKLPAEFASNVDNTVDLLSAPKADELNNSNVNESSPEAAAQVSPQESQNRPSIPTNEEDLENKDRNNRKEEEPTEIKSDEEHSNGEDTDSKQPKDIENERVLDNESVNEGQSNIGDDHQDSIDSPDLPEQSVKTIKDEADDKQTTKKVTTEPNVIEPEKIDEQVQPNEDIVKEHSKPVYSKQPYDDHMDSSMEDPESSNFMSYFFVLTIITVCGYLIFYNKKKLIALLLEGRRGRSTGRRSRSGSRSGRSSSAQYRKLDNNLEEAMGPNSSSSYREVIY